MIAIHPEQLRNLLTGAAIIAAKTTAQIMGGSKDMVLMKDANKRYGHKSVRRWRKSGFLHPKRSDNGCIYIPASELMIANYTEEVQRITPNANDEIRQFLNMQAI